MNLTIGTIREYSEKARCSKPTFVIFTNEPDGHFEKSEAHFEKTGRELPPWKSRELLKALRECVAGLPHSAQVNFLAACPELDLATAKISWGRNAGCSCGCSPGYKLTSKAVDLPMHVIDYRYGYRRAKTVPAKFYHTIGLWLDVENGEEN